MAWWRNSERIVGVLIANHFLVLSTNHGVYAGMKRGSVFGWYTSAILLVVTLAGGLNVNCTPSSLHNCWAMVTACTRKLSNLAKRIFAFLSFELRALKARSFFALHGAMWAQHVGQLLRQVFKVGIRPWVFVIAWIAAHRALIKLPLPSLSHLRRICLSRRLQTCCYSIVLIEYFRRYLATLRFIHR